MLQSKLCQQLHRAQEPERARLQQKQRLAQHMLPQQQTQLGRRAARWRQHRRARPELRSRLRRAQVTEAQLQGLVHQRLQHQGLA